MGNICRSRNLWWHNNCVWRRVTPGKELCGSSHSVDSVEAVATRKQFLCGVQRVIGWAGVGQRSSGQSVDSRRACSSCGIGREDMQYGGRHYYRGDWLSKTLSREGQRTVSGGFIRRTRSGQRGQGAVSVQECERVYVLIRAWLTDIMYIDRYILLLLKFFVLKRCYYYLEGSTIAAQST